jgi:hypothetical protein
MPQGHSGRDVTLQVSNHRTNVINSASFHGDAAGNGQGDTNNPVQMGQTRRTIEVQNWQRGILQSNNFLAPLHHSDFGCGGVAHDGSYNLFKWDRTKGCMVAFRLSNPVVSESANI